VNTLPKRLSSQGCNRRRIAYRAVVAGGLRGGWEAGNARELGEIIARLQALAEEPPVVGMAQELQAIREHLGQLAADNAEVARTLGGSLGLRPPPDLPKQ
jgi:hypothetical protein